MLTQPVVRQPIDTFLIVQSLIALIFVSTLCYLMITGKPIPDLLIGLTGTVIGWYFTSRTPASVVAQVAASVKAFAAAIE